MYYIDYHLHSFHSVDSQCPMDDLCMAAIEAGLDEIAITDHCDPTQRDPLSLSIYDAQAALADMQKMQEKYAGRLSIKRGVELGQGHLYLQAAKNIEALPYDYIIGSVHNPTGSLDLGVMEYHLPCDDIFYLYFDALLEMIKNDHYDCVGHLDYPKRYASAAGYQFRESFYYDYLVSALKEIIAHGKGIEVNCSGLRQRVGSTLPSLYTVKLYRQLGGQIITVGSDAHHQKYVGSGIKEGYQLIQAAGFDYITTFENRRPKFIKL